MQEILSFKEMLDDIVLEKGFPLELLGIKNLEDLDREGFEENDRVNQDLITKVGCLYTMERISSDERVCAAFDNLEYCGISAEVLQNLTSISAETFKKFRLNPSAIKDEEKYEIAVNVLSLYFLFKEDIIQKQKNSKL